MTNNSQQKMLEVHGLKKYFPIQKSAFSRTKGFVKAVDDISLYIDEGETLGVVGESGSGKTTLGKCIIRALEPTEGEINFHLNGRKIDLAKTTKKELRPLRKYMHMIFQDPYTSLNPRMTLLDIISEPLVCNNILKGNELKERVRELLEVVGLEAKHMVRYPHAFSGGQRQRIGIARSLAANPKFIICDEAVSALDVSVQAQILNLLMALQKKYHLTYLFIAHDLMVIEHIANRVAVMYVGKVVEMAKTDKLYKNPKHPYTEALLSAVPKIDPDKKRNRIILTGEVANPAKTPSGCYFHPRCRYAKNICKTDAPRWEEIGEGHFASCHFCKELTLQGIEQ